MLGINARPKVAKVLAPVVTRLARSGVTPDAVTLTGTLGSIAAAVVLIGALVLVGWGFGIEILKRVVPGITAMNPGGTALSFLLAGVALWVRARPSGRRLHALGTACAAAVAAIAMIRIGGYLGGWDWGPDRLLFPRGLELEDRRGSLPEELSRGMKQKLAIACALIHAPRALLLDEPLTGLDPVGIRRMKATILDHARSGAAVILSSHLLHLVEEICSRVLIMRRGRVLAFGTIEDIVAARPELAGLKLEDVFLGLVGQEGVEER